MENLFPTLSDLETAMQRVVSLDHGIRRRRGLRLFSYLVCASVCLVVAVLICVPWTQTIQGQGKVFVYSPSDRPAHVEAPVEGRIVRWFVREGQSVKESDPIVEISDIDPLILEKLDSERRALESKIQASKTAIVTSTKNLERQRQLVEQGLSSRRSFELSLLEVSKLEAELASAESEHARLQVRIAKQASQMVRAARDGIITRISAPQGGVLVKPGDELALLVPTTTERAVELFVNGNDVALLRVGRKARIQFDGWPAIQFSGWPSVAIGSFSGVVELIDPIDDGTGKFRVVIFPDAVEEWPSAQYLRLGARCVGWILLDEVPVGWELWRRFNGFPPMVEKPEAYEKTK